ncbi:hypothetical protein D3C85_495830 [compost metagenome]
MALLDLVAVVLLALLDGHHLGGTALAGYAVDGLGPDLVRRAAGAVDHLFHADAAGIPVRWVAQDDVRNRVGVLWWLALDGLGQVRADPLATVGHQRRGLGQLQRRGLHVALANAEDQGFPGIPGLAVARALPIAGRHQAGGLLEHVQRHALAEAEAGHVVVHPIYAHLVRKIVEVGVIRPHDRGFHVHPAVTGTVPVAVFVVVVRQLVEARVEDPRGRGHHASIQAGHRHHRLDGRARRIEAAQHAVVQRTVDGVAQLGIGLEADAGDEGIGVEARLADHRQHVAAGRLDGDYGAAAAAQGLFGRFLQAYVEGQYQVLAGFRIGALEYPQDAPAGVGLDFLVAHLAVQLVFVEALDAGLADMVGAAVVHRIELFELLFVDPPDIAHRMGEMRTLRVMPHQLRHHLHAGQAELVHRHAGDLLLGQFEEDGHRLEGATPLAHAFLEQRTVIRGQLQHLDYHVEGRLPVAGPLAGDAEAEAGPVVGHYHAVAVEDQPTGGRDRLHMDAVVLGQGRVVLVLDHLQVIEAGDQHASQQQYRHRAHDHASTHQAGVLFVVFQADRLRHGQGLLVIGVAGQHGPGPVDLFADEDTYQRVRQRQRRQRPALFAAGANLGRQPFGAADHEVDGARIQAPAIQFGGQLLGTPGPTLDFQGDYAFPRLHLGQHGLAFLADHPRYVGILAARGQGNLHQFQAEFGRQALDVLPPALLHPARHARADCDKS